MSLQRIGHLARENYETRAHVDKHLAVGRQTYEVLRSIALDVRLSDDTANAIMSLPIILDVRVGAHSWRLMDNAKPFMVLESGHIGSPDCEHPRTLNTTTLLSRRRRMYCPACGAEWMVTT